MVTPEEFAVICQFVDRHILTVFLIGIMAKYQNQRNYFAVTSFGKYNLNHVDSVTYSWASVRKCNPEMKSWGCKTVFCFKNIKRNMVFLALKSTSQSRAHWDMEPRSRFIVIATVEGFSTMIYKLVPSAKKRI